MSDDVLSLLLPDASAGERARIRDVVKALRLLRDDARGAAGGRVDPPWRRARSELERLDRVRRVRAVEALLHTHLAALRTPDSFLDLGPRPMDHDAAWRHLVSGSDRTGARLPTPIDAPRVLVQRLLDAATASGAPDWWRLLWDTRARHLQGEPTEAERLWRRVLRDGTARGDPARVLARFAAGLVAARLECFQPARALELCAAHELLGHDVTLRRLLGWSALLCDRSALAGELLRALPEARHALPRPLSELCTDRPELAPLLASAAQSEAGGECTPVRGGRRALGAVLLGVFAPARTGGVQVLALDVEREARAAVERRLAAGMPWPASALGLARRFRWRPGEAPPGGCLANGTSALALVPIAAPAVASQVWIQVESRHQLLPSSAQLAALARAWNHPTGAPERVSVSHGGATLVDLFPPQDPRDELARELFDALGAPRACRFYWVEPDEDDRWRIRAERGAGLRDHAVRPGGGAALQAARTGARVVRYDGRANSLHASAAAGVALPVTESLPRERVLALLVLESERPELLSEARIDSARRALSAVGPRWWAASFRAWHRERWGDDLAWDPERRFLSALQPLLHSAAESSAPLVLVGSPGSGRRTLARWLHFRGPRAAHALLEGWSTEEGGTRLLELEELDRPAQLRLAHALAESSRERVLLLAGAPPHVLRERGQLASELERRLDPLPLLVPALRDRRDEIPGLVQVLAQNSARRASLAQVRFDDAALAHLWRQDWRGGVSELASLLAHLAGAHAGRAIGGDDVCAAFRARGLAFRERLPSQRPRALDLALALESTRHAVGSANLARAARYLGWDPDTLAARLGSSGGSLRK